MLERNSKHCIKLCNSFKYCNKPFERRPTATAATLCHHGFRLVVVGTKIFMSLLLSRAYRHTHTTTIQPTGRKGLLLLQSSLNRRSSRHTKVKLHSKPFLHASAALMPSEWKSDSLTLFECIFYLIKLQFQFTFTFFILLIQMINVLCWHDA